MTLDPIITNKRVVNYFSTLEEKFINLHGSKYSYEHAVYTSAKTPINIYCNSCSQFFTQTPDNHLQGKGCKFCAVKELHNKQRMSLTEFITKSRSIHGATFDYSKVNYVSTSTTVTIICPNHGEFQITPKGHWVSKTGCTKCGSLEMWNSRDKPTTESFIIDANKIHNNLYDYSQVIYSDRRDPMVIICPVHGKFKQSPDTHLKGSGCPSCGIERVITAKLDTLDSFKSKAVLVHGDYYSYDNVEYLHSQTQVTITCPIHGDFKQAPATHLQGAGCATCNKGWSFAPVPTLLYYLRITTNGQTAYKIGITMHSVERRYSKTDMANIVILWAKEYFTGQEAYEEEQRILKKFKQFKYIGADLLESGNTELFSADVLNKDLTR
jgi:hypothetical protein